jgi:hypothetical protein
MRLMGERKRRPIEDLSPVERAKLESIRARWKTAEYRAQEERVRQLAREEFTPAEPRMAEGEAAG